MSHQIKQIIEGSFEIIELKNNSISAKVLVNIGNTLYSFRFNGDEKMYFPFSFIEYKNNSKLAGNPFMHPWANRLEGEYIQVENQKYHFPEQHKHLLYRDGNNLPLHGLLLKSDKWKTLEIFESEQTCHHVAELVFDDENMLAIFPFKHKIQIKHSLQNNELKIETTIINEDEKDMPISFGFHPYFLKNALENYLQIPTNEVIDVDDKMIPNGSILDRNEKWDFIQNIIALKNNSFDDGFKDLQFENDFSTFKLNNIAVKFDQNYPFAQIYAPTQIDKPYVCIEPMTAITNAINKDKCKLLEKNQVFTATFSIKL